MDLGRTNLAKGKSSNVDGFIMNSDETPEHPALWQCICSQKCLNKNRLTAQLLIRLQPAAVDTCCLGKYAGSFADFTFLKWIYSQERDRSCTRQVMCWWDCTLTLSLCACLSPFLSNPLSVSPSPAPICPCHWFSPTVCINILPERPPLLLPPTEKHIWMTDVALVGTADTVVDTSTNTVTPGFATQNIHIQKQRITISALTLILLISALKSKAQAALTPYTGSNTGVRLTARRVSFSISFSGIALRLQRKY